MLLFGGAVSVSAAPAPSTITLVMNSSESSLSSRESVAAGSKLTLVAAVSSGSTALTTGQVNFCDASAAYCTDIHILGTAQLTSAGTAQLKFIPGIGSHSYKAVFVGTRNGTTAYAGSASSTVALTVTGAYPTTTQIRGSGIPGNYTLTATVTGIINSPSVAAPTGMVSFLDTTTNKTMLGASALGTGTPGLSFLNSSNPVTAPKPNVIAAGDFNGDGIPDLAVSSSNPNPGGVVLSILLGNGDGTFTETASPTVGLYPGSITVGDFNDDGIPDLAVTSLYEQTVTILLSNGDGTFASSVPILHMASAPESVAVGDLNSDGIADLAVVAGYSIKIFLGNGDGTFNATAASPKTGRAPITVAMGDFNGDGNVDLAVTNSLDQTVTILLGKGDGTFTAAPVSLATGGSSCGLVVADFNGDGILDLAASNYDGEIDKSAVLIFLGGGDGTFREVAAYAENGLNFQSMVVRDFNGDGVPDIAVAGFWDKVNVLLGKGDGSFASSTIPLAADISMGSGYLAAADFNGDGIPDLAEPNQDLSGPVALLLAQPNQTATATVTGISLPGTGTRQVNASYPGDSVYTSSASASTELTAVKATPTVTVTPSSYSITTAQALSVTVVVRDGGNLTPTGFVTLNSGSYTSEEATLISANATISVPANSLATGTDTLTVNYRPDIGSSYIYNTASGWAPVLVTIPSTMAAAPTFSPAAGTYTTAQTITISDATPAATIYYTTNGTTPTTSSVVYRSPITVSSNETIEAIAAANGYTPSDVATAAYTINNPPIPVPVLDRMSPSFTSAGGAAFILTVNGSGFTSDSRIYWGTTPLSTQFGSGTQLTAQVPAPDVAAAGITTLTVQTPTPGVGISNSLQFEVDSAKSGTTTPPSFTTLTATITPGSTATYSVTLPSSATHISAMCLNLPSGATCSYSATSAAVMISTSLNTPAGTYQITVIFTETEPGTATAVGVLPILLLPFIFARRKLGPRRIWFTACFGLMLLVAAATMSACGGGVGSESIPTATPTSTHQVTNSGTVTLTIQ
jgi:hypothetical protein